MTNQDQDREEKQQRILPTLGSVLLQQTQLEDDHKQNRNKEETQLDGIVGIGTEIISDKHHVLLAVNLIRPLVRDQTRQRLGGIHAQALLDQPLVTYGRLIEPEILAPSLWTMDKNVG